MPRSPDTTALARFVLAPAKRTSGKSLDQQWDDLARFMRGAGSALARWLAVAQMHSVYRQMRVRKSRDVRRGENLLVRHFVERACAETGLSRPTIYNYVDRARALVEVLGPATLKEMLSGHERIANDENILIKIAQLPAARAAKVAKTYMHGRGETAAARMVERFLHDQRLSSLGTAHEVRLRGGSLVVEDDGHRTPISNDVRNVVLFGDALVHLRETIPAESVQCVVTSPPFFGQRDFGTRHWFAGDPACKHDRRVTHPPFHSGQVPQTKYRTPKASLDGQTATTHSCSRCGAWRGQLGQEPDVGTFIEHLVGVFREVRRTLRTDGVCWVEIGDTYNSGTTTESLATRAAANGAWTQSRDRRGASASDVPVKSLLLIPQRLAVALQHDGWIVRSEIIWHKRGALPESVRDRPTRSHTTVLMLTKASKYFYDATAVTEPAVGTTHARGPRNDDDPRKWAGYAAVGEESVTVRNLRTVRSMPVGRFKDAHTATFPPELPERCILASTSEHGACARCGAPWNRRIHQARVGGNVRRDGSVAPLDDKNPAAKYLPHRMRAGRLGKSTTALPPTETIGWEPTCGCGIAEVRPCVVLDPFAGSGTTLAVARQLGRDYIGIEINEREYRRLIERRLTEVVRPREHRTRRAARTSVGDS